MPGGRSWPQRDGFGRRRVGSGHGNGSHGARPPRWQVVGGRTSPVARSANANVGGAFGGLSGAFSGVNWLGGGTRHVAARFGSAVAVAAGGLTASTRSRRRQAQVPRALTDLQWVQELATRPGMQEELSPGQELRTNPFAKAVVDSDHMFGVMEKSGQILEHKCFYDRAAKQFYSVISLGKDVCGFPQTLHGGLTASIFDETFGGLAVCMWKAGALGFRPPAYTVRLEVDYKRKVPAGTVVQCCTSVESVDKRKVWMSADLTDGQGKKYANARALFVAPRVSKILFGWIPGFVKEES
uniref:Thioesterase domain-containing protein n=1 Tax=Chlamydomonas euryale TaxID=1486919 RepID=A0A7R9YRT3_9CHLO|mmetsp:Transcript_152/g.382  ORF Transcript_152/g.382 Transcript_152/m.382 type:complete len:297 (+) Transcript_152:140-1030(+)